MNEGHLLLGPLLIPLLGALLCPVFDSRPISAKNNLYTIFCMTQLLCCVILGIGVAQGSTYELSLQHFGGLGLSIRADGFRAMYVILSSLLWLCTALFGHEYFQKDKTVGRFHSFSLLTLAATVGVFLSADLVTTFLFFEWASLCSYALVAHDKSPKAVHAANITLGIAIFGSLTLLMGLFLLQHFTGTLVIADLAAACVLAADKNIIYVCAALLLVGFGAKAGLVPLHMWLPLAHPAAPAPASALLSGILTKTGIFGVAIISCELLSGDIPWGIALLLLGLVTMLLGAVLALFSSDIKHALACSTISQIGFITLGIATQNLLDHHNALAVRGTLLHMVNHSLAKLVLFSVAGVVYLNAHKLNLHSLRGWGHHKPLLAFCFLVPALSIAGIPPFGGYISKTLLHESLVECIHLFDGQPLALLLQGAEMLFFLVGGLTLAYMAKLFYIVFVAQPPAHATTKKPYMAFATRTVLALSALLIALLGLFPHHLAERLAVFAEGFMHGHAPEHAVDYYALQNLKGAGISIALGLAIFASLWITKSLQVPLAPQTRANTKHTVPLVATALPTSEPATSKTRGWYEPYSYLFHTVSKATPAYHGVASSFSFGLLLVSVGLCVTFAWLLWTYAWV